MAITNDDTGLVIPPNSQPVPGPIQISGNLNVVGNISATGTIAADVASGLPYIFLQPLGGGLDDAPQINAAIAVAAASSVACEIVCAADTFSIYSEIQTPINTSHTIKLRGQVPTYIDLSNPGTRFRAMGAMRSALALLGQSVLVEDIKIDANRLATYGVLLRAAGITSVLTRVYEINALRDGFHFDDTGTGSDMAHLIDCSSQSNGTVWYGSAAVLTLFAGYLGVKASAAGTITVNLTSRIVAGVGTAFLSLGLRSGDFLFVGTNLQTGQWLMIQSVDSDTQITLTFRSSASATVAATSNWAATSGSALRIVGAGINGIVHIDGGNFVNSPVGVISQAQYGATLEKIHSSYNATFGLVLGFADDGQVLPLSYSNFVTNFYMELNQVASVFLGGAPSLTLLSPITGDPAFIRFPTDFTINNLRQGNSSIIMRNGDTDIIGSFALDGYRLQSFSVTLFNNAGTLQHRIVCEGISADTALRADKISNKSTVFVNTPAISNVVGFASGAGVNASGEIVLDTANDQSFGAAFPNQFLYASPVAITRRNGAVIYADAGFVSSNINGVTRHRLHIRFRDATDTVYAITAANVNTTLEFHLLVGLR